MKKKNQRVNLLILLLLIVCSSCISHNYQDFPQVELQKKAMNKVFKIEELPQFRNSHKNNDLLYLHVKNLSDKTIIFSSDSCIKLFAKIDGNWITVEDSMGYPSGNDFLLPEKNFPPGLILVPSPYIPEMLEPQIIRIIIIGHLENAEDKLVGAYLDVKILP
jgi:hypothetical protein